MAILQLITLVIEIPSLSSRMPDLEEKPIGYFGNRAKAVCPCYSA
jgi:hypothetical protein